MDRANDAFSERLDQLAIEAGAGSATALDELLGTMLRDGLARNAIRRMTVDPDLIEDIEQEVLIIVSRRISSFRGDSRFTTWLHRVATNAAAGHLRARKNQPLAPDATSAAGSGEVGRLSSLLTTRAWIAELVADLAPHYREPLHLREFDQLTYEQIADRLGLNLNTAKSRVARARALLASRIERERRSP